MAAIGRINSHLHTICTEKYTSTRSSKAQVYSFNKLLKKAYI